MISGLSICTNIISRAVSHP